MRDKIGAHQLAIPSPVVFRIGCRMDADKSATCLYIPFKGGFLGGIKNIAGGIQENNGRSEEHTSELQSLMRISYAVFCLTKKTTYHLAHHKTYIKQTHDKLT